MRTELNAHVVLQLQGKEARLGASKRAVLITEAYPGRSPGSRRSTSGNESPVPRGAPVKAKSILLSRSSRLPPRFRGI